MPTTNNPSETTSSTPTDIMNGVKLADNQCIVTLDEGQKLRGRAASYDPLTRAYLDALGMKP